VRELSQPGIDAERLFPSHPVQGIPQTHRQDMALPRWRQPPQAEPHDACQRPVRIRQSAAHPQAFANHCFPHRRVASSAAEARDGHRSHGRKEEEPRAPAAAQRGSDASKTAARPRDSSCGRKSNIDASLGSKNRGELRQLTSRNRGTGKCDSIFQVTSRDIT